MSGWRLKTRRRLALPLRDFNRVPHGRSTGRLALRHTVRLGATNVWFWVKHLFHYAHERVPMNDNVRRQVPSDFDQPPPIRSQASFASSYESPPTNERASIPRKDNPKAAAGRIGLVGLVLLVAGVLCGLVPHTKHMPAVSPSRPYAAGQLPAYSSPAVDYYCGSPWVPEYGGCTTSDFGAFPQLAVLFVVLGLVSLGVYFVLRSGTPG